MGKNYEIGYGKPPRKSQFKPGHSGNKKGRPKGRSDPAALLRKVFDTPVRLRDGDNVRTASTLEAMFLRLKHDGLQGDPKAVMAVLKLISQIGALEPELPPPRQLIIQLGDVGMSHDEWGDFHKWRRETGRDIKKPPRK